MLTTSAGESAPAFEDGGWLASGLWHLVSAPDCLPPSLNAPSSAAYYGQDMSCDYDTGNPTSGDLISPPIQLAHDGHYLRFDDTRLVEASAGPWDRTELAITSDGGATWDIRWAKDSTDPAPGGWRTSPLISLAAYAGQTIHLRFRFDSIDDQDNGHIGWLVGNIVIEDGPVLESAPPIVTLQSPDSGTEINPCTYTVLQGSTLDMENRDLGAQLRWTSSLDGELGVGRFLPTVLSSGTHQLTATVIDYDGTAGSATASVVVLQTGSRICHIPDFEPRLYSGDGDGP